MFIDLPFARAMFLPIHRSTVRSLHFTVTFRVLASHETTLPVASAIARIGRSVREFWMTGATSSLTPTPSRYIQYLPTVSVRTLVVSRPKVAVTALSASIVTVIVAAVPDTPPDQPSNTVPEAGTAFR